MADFYTELAEYIEAQDATVDTVFTGPLPPDPTDCSAIIGRVGTTLNSSRDIEGMMFPRFQVISRNTDFNDCVDEMNKIRTVIHGMIMVSLTSWKVLRLHVDQEGGPLGQDDKGNFECSINYLAQIRELEDGES